MKLSVQAAMVRRTASPDDGRSVRVRFTAAGRRLEAALTEEIDGLLDPLLSRLGGPDRVRLGTLLDLLVEADGMP